MCGTTIWEPFQQVQGLTMSMVKLPYNGNLSKLASALYQVSPQTIRNIPSFCMLLGHRTVSVTRYWHAGTPPKLLFQRRHIGQTERHQHLSKLICHCTGHAVTQLPRYHLGGSECTPDAEAKTFAGTGSLGLLDSDMLLLLLMPQLLFENYT